MWLKDVAIVLAVVALGTNQIRVLSTHEKLKDENRTLQQFANCIYSFGVLIPEMTKTKEDTEKVIQNCQKYNKVVFERITDKSFQLIIGS